MYAVPLPLTASSKKGTYKLWKTIPEIELFIFFESKFSKTSRNTTLTAEERKYLLSEILA